MNQVFKTGLSIFLMFLAALVLSAIITADSQAQAAKKYAQDVTKEIESANLSDNVINVCIQTADDNGPMPVWSICLLHCSSNKHLLPMCEHPVRNIPEDTIPSLCNSH